MLRSRQGRCVGLFSGAEVYPLVGAWRRRGRLAGEGSRCSGGIRETRGGGGWWRRRGGCSPGHCGGGRETWWARLRRRRRESQVESAVGIAGRSSDGGVLAERGVTKPGCRLCANDTESRFPHHCPHLPAINHTLLIDLPCLLQW